MRQQTIRYRLLMLTLLPPLGLLTVILGYFIYQDDKLMRETLYERGITVSRYLASAAEYSVITGNTQQLEHISKSILQGDIVGMRVYDFDGDAIFSTGDTLLSSDVDVKVEGVGQCGGSDDQFLFCAPILLDAMPVSDFESGDASQLATSIGYVELTIATHLIAAKRDAMLYWSLLLVLLVVGMAIVLSRLMERQLVEPLTSLGGMVDRVRRGDLKGRIRESASGELLALQQGVNVMIGALEDARDNMQLEIDNATASLLQALHELEQRNKELQQERQRAESASLAKSQFLATMSHEIRTPLGGMIGMLQLIRDGSENRQQLDCIDSLEGAAQSLRQLIDDILDFSRLEVGKLTLLNQNFSPLDVIEEVMVMLTPSAQHKGLHFVLDVGDGLPTGVEGDPLRFRQILINLAANAIKFTHEGEVVLRTYPVTLGDECRYRFEICDSGIGIAAEKQAMVFESFTQIEEGDARSYGGSGLGTTISRELVQMMGGDIGLDSELGKGSCFWFELPWLCSPQCSNDKKQQSRGRALLFEPHAASAKAIASMLQAEGLKVQRAESYSELEQALATDIYDWVMVGESLPASAQQDRLARLTSALPSTTRLVQLGFINGQRHHSEQVLHLTKPLLPSVLHKLVGGEQKIVESMKELETRALTVLLAEDDEINARVISHFLQKGGHQVERVTDGEAALQALRARHFDCVLMDMRMPLLDGLEATRSWRLNEAEGEHLPIIALTANASEDDRERCREVGMDDYLTKPVTSETLLKTLSRCCS